MSTTPPPEEPTPTEPTAATPPEDLPSDEQATRQLPGIAVVKSSGDIARLPLPGNAELGIWLLVVILFAIITLASDDVDAAMFVLATAAVTFAYLISRGIAKAGRVLEQ
jgi:hypothetical protein